MRFLAGGGAWRLTRAANGRAVHALCLARDSGRVAQFTMLDAALFARPRAMDANTAGTLAGELARSASALETAAVGRLHALHAALVLGVENAEAMQRFISAYLEGDGDVAAAKSIPAQALGDAGKVVVRGDVDRILREAKFRQAPACARSPRAVARILHGVASPAFPREDWAKKDVWQRHSLVDFADLVAVASEAFA